MRRRRNACRISGSTSATESPCEQAPAAQGGGTSAASRDQVLVQIKAQRQKGPLRAGIRDVKELGMSTRPRGTGFRRSSTPRSPAWSAWALNDHADGPEKVSILLASCRRVMTSPSMSIGYFPCSGARWSNFSFNRLAVLAVSPLLFLSYGIILCFCTE